MSQNRKTAVRRRVPRAPDASKVQHSPGGLKGRWLVNSLSFVVVILAAVIIFVSVGFSQYYYTTIRNNLEGRVNTTAATFRNYWTSSYEQFYASARRYVVEYEFKDKLEVQFLNQYSHVILSTSGMSADSVPQTGDVEKALTTLSVSTWIGEDPLSGERVMSCTAPLFTQGGSLIGGLRVVTSLTIAERQIHRIILLSLLVGVVFVLLVILSNRYFLKTILEPVVRINEIVKEITAGRYGMRLQKIYDDEIGQLCDNINYMSEEIARAERMKNDFISSLSHELRTPLTAIGGWSETLLAGGAEDPEALSQGLEIIQKESKRLTSMVEELMDYARMESGRMKLVVENFDLSLELYEAVYMYKNLLEKEHITLEYNESGTENYFISGDRHRMKQVFLNVIDNAAKYGADGRKIKVSILRRQGQVVVKVRDYGPGIPEDELPFVKEKFYKGSSKQRGSGIGLAVTEEIVKLHGGTLDILSQLGQGTVAVISVPALFPAPSTEKGVFPNAGPPEPEPKQPPASPKA